MNEPYKSPFTMPVKSMCTREKFPAGRKQSEPSSFPGPSGGLELLQRWNGCVIISQVYQNTALWRITLAAAQSTHNSDDLSKQFNYFTTTDSTMNKYIVICPIPDPVTSISHWTYLSSSIFYNTIKYLHVNSSVSYKTTTRTEHIYSNLLYV